MQFHARLRDSQAVLAGIVVTTVKLWQLHCQSQIVTLSNTDSITVNA